MRTLSVILILLPSLLQAQAYNVEITGDLNGDGIPDRAVLSQEGENDSATLHIYTGSVGGLEMLEESAPNLVWMGSGMAGQQPDLRMTPHGSLEVISMNEAIGRNRWNQVLTIAFRDDIFKVAGFTYSWYDTLDLENQGVCDINLLTGKGVLSLGPEDESKALKTDLKAMQVRNWIRKIPVECGL